MLNFESERYLISLAKQRLFARQKEISSDLHRNSAGTYARASDDVGIDDAQRREPVNPRMFVKIGVFSRENGLPHMQRNLGKLNDAAPFLAKFRQGGAVFRQNAQRQLGLIVR